MPKTPSAVSETLSEIFGCTIVCKFENLQFTASFKERGAANRLALLSPDEKKRGVVAVSAGNHAQAVARHAKLLGVPATIVMPEATPFVKVARTRFLGAEVELAGSDLAGAMSRGREIADGGKVLVHPYDDPDVIAGQGTVMLELLEHHDDLDVVVVPVGGGGLLAGCCAALDEPERSGVELVGVQSSTHPAFARAMGADVEQVVSSTIAEGIAVDSPGSIALEVAKSFGAEVVVVDEPSIEHAIDLLLEIEKVVVEGAGAAAIAAIAADPGRFAGRKVGVVLTGGNIDPRLLASVIQRGLVRSGRIARVRVELDDRPGALAVLLEHVASSGANVIEVTHQRLFADVPLRRAEVDLTIETQDAAHRDRAVKLVCDSGFSARVLPLDS